MNRLPLSPRLKTLYKITPECNCFADIGTDHAYLPVYLCKNNKCKTAIASDIVKGPLERAKATIKKYNMEGRISVRLGGGVSTLKKDEADVVLVAGMGGLIISDIIKDGIDILKNVKNIILQPMTAVSDLREYLYNNNWKIDKEYLVKDNGKLYNIMTVSYTDEKLDYTDTDIYIGRYLIDNKPELFEEYLDKKILKLNKKIKGLSLSTAENAEDTLNTVKDMLKKITEIKENI